MVIETYTLEEVLKLQGLPISKTKLIKLLEVSKAKVLVLKVGNEKACFVSRNLAKDLDDLEHCPNYYNGSHNYLTRCGILETYKLYNDRLNAWDEHLFLKIGPNYTRTNVVGAETNRLFEFFRKHRYLPIKNSK